MKTRTCITAVLLPLALLLAGCSQVDDSFRNEDSCNVCHAGSFRQQDVHRFHLSDAAMSAFPFHDRSDTVTVSDVIVRGSRRDTLHFASPADSTLDSAVLQKQRRLLAHNYDCGTCHAGYHPQGVRVNPDFHRNGTRDVVLDDSRLPDSVQKQFVKAGSMVLGLQTCDNVACHGAGRILDPATGAGKDGVLWRTTPVSFGDTLNCNSCHNTAGHKPFIIRTCASCHLDVPTEDGKGIRDFARHMNGVLDVRQ